MEIQNILGTGTHLQTLLSFSHEEIRLIVKKYWFVIFTPIILTLVFALSTAVFSGFIFLFILHAPFLFFASLFIIVSLVSVAITNIIIDWYFDLYIVTTHKILEVCYTPPFSLRTNNVLLDQVKCTEIDVRINGILNEFLNKGDIVITFDRPTREEEFILKDIHDPRKMAMFLSAALNTQDSQAKNISMWVKEKSHNEKKDALEKKHASKRPMLRFTEYILSKKA